MTRGNQRDLAREKNMKKLQGKKPANLQDGNAGLTLEQRKHRDAEIMRQKQVEKQLAKQGAGGGGQDESNAPGTSAK